MLTLEVAARDGKENTDALRKRGFVPAIFYGRAEKATPISIEASKFERVFKEAGETTIVTLKGAGIEKDTLIHEVQVHPVSGKTLHADFYVLEKGKKVTISVPLEWEGEGAAEKAGNVLVKALHEIEIEVAPQELPHALAIDLSKLENVGDHITAGEIKLPSSATLLTNPEEIVASVTEFKAEVEAPVAEAAAPEGAAAPESADQSGEENKS